VQEHSALRLLTLGLLCSEVEHLKALYALRFVWFHPSLVGGCRSLERADALDCSPHCAQCITCTNRALYALESMVPSLLGGGMQELERAGALDFSPSCAQCITCISRTEWRNGVPASAASWWWRTRSMSSLRGSSRTRRRGTSRRCSSSWQRRRQPGAGLPPAWQTAWKTATATALAQPRGRYPGERGQG